ncbi:MAG: efflux RND transporter periplasmic adaptor subunit [Candidatus Aminicenantes bacterium]|nr:efflux RND transporter periplasmic adaptor subunit [Candidatus Aminicenantes bacterium]
MRIKVIRSRPMKKKKVIILMIFVALISLIIFLNLRSQREKSIKVTVEKVVTKDLTSIVSASGEVKPKKNINLSALVPGRIIKIGVKEGDFIKAGDFLLQLDSAQYEANAERDRALIQAYRSQLIEAEARMKREENQYERQKKLYEEQLIPLEQLEAAKVQLDISRAQVQALRHQIQQAEASLKSTLDNLKKTIYVSPIDGIVTSLRVEEGEIAVVGTMNNPGTVLMTIADLSEMEVEVEVDETDVISLAPGQRAEVRVDALPNQVLSGHVTEIGSSALEKSGLSSQESRNFKVTITLDNPPPSLKPGLSATADIIIAQKERVLAVPVSAIVVREKEGSSGQKKVEEEGVFIIDNERARFQPIKRGIMGEMDVEIIEGLKEGQEIITGPYSALRELKDGHLIKRQEVPTKKSQE